MWRVAVRIVLLLVVVGAAAGLMYGPLFAWSPITPGFARSRDGRVVYLHRTGQPPSPDTFVAERDLALLESAFGLGLLGDVSVVLCDDWADLRRFTPWLPTAHTLGARTLEIGTVVYMTPLSRQRKDAGDILRHELIHVLLLRHAPLRARLEIARQWWVMEGLAVRYGNPGAYRMPRYDRYRVLQPLLPQIFDGGLATPGEASVAERYALAGALIAYLEQGYGRALVQQFVARYLRDPGEWRNVFARVFGEPFDDVVGAFGRSLDEEPPEDADPELPPDPDDPEWTPPPPV